MPNNVYVQARTLAVLAEVFYEGQWWQVGYIQSENPHRLNARVYLRLFHLGDIQVTKEVSLPLGALLEVREHE